MADHASPVNYTYTGDLGQPETMVDSSGTWTALYDQYHRSVGMTNPWAETTTVAFDSAGRVERKNLPNGMYEKYTFDDRSRPTHIKTYNSADVLQDTKEYVWDVASRVMQAKEGGIWTTYGYDQIDQLTSEVKSALNYTASYTYDPNGNRLTRTVNGSTETYAYDEADKLLSITGGPNPRTYTYDLAGRTKTIADTLGTTLFTCDYDSRVTSITYPNTSADSFGYNGLSARMSSSGVNGAKTFRRAGISVLSPVLSDGTKEYTPGVSSRENGASTFQHSGLKNALDQTDSSEIVTASRHYDAFGNVVSSSGTWHGPFGYAGSFGYQEDKNGLKLLGHRYYDSDTGRFLTSDPIGDTNNWYLYTGNNPITGTDPEGLAVILTAIGIGLLIYAITTTVITAYENYHVTKASLEADDFLSEAIRDGYFDENDDIYNDHFGLKDRGDQVREIIPPIIEQAIDITYGHPTRGISPVHASLLTPDDIKETTIIIEIWHFIEGVFFAENKDPE